MVIWERSFQKGKVERAHHCVHSSPLLLGNTFHDHALWMPEAADGTTHCIYCAFSYPYTPMQSVHYVCTLGHYLVQ